MTTKLRRHKVWDRTTRIFHWLNAVTVLSLIALGLLILNAKSFGIEGEGKILLKSVHVYIGYIFVINLIWRFIWAFIGNHYARWRQFLPVGKNYQKSLRTYLDNFESGVSQQYVGHNPAARLIISIFFLLLSAQAITGFTLAGTDLYLPPFGNYFSEWVTEGDQELLKELKPGDKNHVVDSAYKEMRSFRDPFITVHNYGFYLIVAMIMIHIMGVIVTEIKEKNGLISAMVTGEKVLDGSPLDIEDKYEEEREGDD